MASKRVHIETANRFHETLAYLCDDVPTHAPWIVTVAFYKGLHLVEAAFAEDKDIRHTNYHQKRREALTSFPRYRNLHKHYTRLEAFSRCARYLSTDTGKDVARFEDYLPAERIGSEVLFHRLKQVEKSCLKWIGAKSNLLSVDLLKAKFQAE